jgi:hypothetical protein
MLDGTQGTDRFCFWLTLTKTIINNFLSREMHKGMF